MLNKLQNYDASIPKLKKNLSTRHWSSLFIYDLIFGLTASRKNKSNKILKKNTTETSIGKYFISAHESNVEKILRNNRNRIYNEPIEIPSISADNFTSEDLAFWEKKINQPLVIKNFLRDAPILELTSQDKLIEDYGEREVMCIESGTLAGKKEESNIGQNLNIKKVTLKDFLTLPEFENHYINNFFGLFDNDDFLNYCRGKELEELMQRPNVLTQWFVARNKNTGSTLHCAVSLNLFLNVKGRKEWYFIDPSYSSIMKPAMSKHGIFCVSELEESFDENFYKRLIQDYPFMKHVPIYKTVLEEGDMLFNPPWWWHRVKNLSSQTIGIATRFESPIKAITNSKTFTAALTIESLKDPKKSPVYFARKALKNKDHAKSLIDDIFSSNENDSSTIKK